MNHIALIFGGPSAEHDVSLVSAKNIFEVLNQTQMQVSLIGITKQKVWKLIPPQSLITTSFQEPLNLESCGKPIELIKENNQFFITNKNEKLGPINLAFPVIHGPFGEDGQLQTELNNIGIPFVGSDSSACKNSFDKVLTKKIIDNTDIAQANYISFEQDIPSFADVQNKLGLPFFIKPANMGSSLGISKVSQQSEYKIAIEEALKFDTKILVEESIKGREIECALLDNGDLKASGLGEVKPHYDFYSYEAKYLDPNGADLIIPAPLDTEISEKIKNMAIQCFKTLDCRHYSRADFFLTDDNQIYFNEINTYPGFTSISQFPLLWQQEGMSYKDLILHLVKMALENQTA